MAAVAVDDDFTVEVGGTGSGNIFANDTLGSPAAALLAGGVVIDAGHAYPVGSPFRIWDGGFEVGVAVATVTVSSDGAIVFTGIAEGTGLFHYVFDQNGESGDAATVFISVVLPPVTPTTPSSTTTSTTSTTTTSTSTTTSTTTTTPPPIAPIPVVDEAIGVVGSPITINLLANDVLGEPPATIVGFEMRGTCTLNGIAYTLNEATGELTSPAVDTPRSCDGLYSIGNAAGAGTADIFVVFGPT